MIIILLFVFFKLSMHSAAVSSSRAAFQEYYLSTNLLSIKSGMDKVL